jgi:methionyl-tRNA synthetase
MKKGINYVFKKTKKKVIKIIKSKSENKKFYITTALPYVNAGPHLGHVLEYIQTDTIARYHRLKNEEVFLLTGSDENSLKNVQAAEAKGIPIQELCNENTAKFIEIIEKMGFSYNNFIRTSNKKEHWPGVQKLWKLCYKNGDIYTKKYTGLYCVGCEAFYKEE